MNKHELQKELDVLRRNLTEASPLNTFLASGLANIYGSIESTSVARHNAILSKIRLIEALETELTWRIADAFFGEKRTQEIPDKIKNALFFERYIDMQAPEIPLRILYVFREAAYQLVRDYYPNTPEEFFFKVNDFGLKIIFSMREVVISPNEQEY